MHEKLFSLLNVPAKNEAQLTSKKATAGFDGFVDTIARIIKSKNESGVSFFSSIQEYGNYIVSKAGASCSIEVEEISARPGGNMPLMSNALAGMGVEVNCIGAFGYPQQHPVFNSLHPNCHIYSFTEPGTSTAYEFNDGKIFLAQMKTLNEFGWEQIKNIIGLETIISLYQQSDLICLDNWSEIDASTGIWKGLLADVFPELATSNKKQIAFFDLSDCSKRSDGSITEALALIKEFTQYARVVVSMNKNEARRIFEVLYKTPANEDLHQTGEMIFAKLDIEILTLHAAKEAMAYSKNDKCSSKSFFVDHPVISTGAGDNFNAGFCTALLMEFNLQSCLIFANATAGVYTRTGSSPRLKDVIQFLQERKEEIQ